MRKDNTAFTLIELLVVVTIIVVLLALLTPALDTAIEQANIAVCGSHLKGIGQASVTYALENKKVFIICRNRLIQNIFSPLGQQQDDATADDAKVDWLAALASVGLAESEVSDVGNGQQNVLWFGQQVPVNTGVKEMQHGITKIWNCPSRNFKSGWDPQYRQMVVAYQYFGGMRHWHNAAGTFNARSPVSLATSSGGWALTADMILRAHQRWDDDNGYPQFYGDPVAHRAADGYRPAGGNVGYVDGSVVWSPFDDMVYIHVTGSDQLNFGQFWRQNDLGDYGPVVPDAAEGRNIKD